MINRKAKKLEIKYISKYHTHSRILFYNLNENVPYLIKHAKFDKKSNNDIIIHFPYAPTHKKKRDNYNEVSDYFLENYNSENNLLCFDCPYKSIYIPNCSKDDLDQIYNQIFRLEKNEILVNEKIEVLDFDYYIRKVKELK